MAIGTGDDRDDDKELRQEKPRCANCSRERAPDEELRDLQGFSYFLRFAFAGIWTEFKKRSRHPIEADSRRRDVRRPGSRDLIEAPQRLLVARLPIRNGQDPA